MARSNSTLLFATFAAISCSGCHDARSPAPVPFYATVHSAYRVTDLGILPGGLSVYVTGINSKSQVSGWVKLKDSTTHAFLWDGKMLDLGTSAAFPSCKGFAINDQSQIVGQDLGGPGDSQPHSFVWKSGNRTMLPKVAVSLGQNGIDMEATAINNQGEVVGTAGYLWQNGGTSEIGFPSVGINDSGKVVGQESAPYAPGTPGYTEDLAPEAQSTALHPFLWESGGSTDLGLIPGAEYAEVSGISAAGQVTGWMTPFMSPAGFENEYSFLWDGNKLVKINALSGYSVSLAYGLNAHGQVVGKCIRHRGYAHAYCWQNGETLDLNDCIPKHTGWVLEAAYKINAQGQIIGVGTHSSTHYRAFLLTPQS